MNVELLIQNGDQVFIPIVEEGITWSTERKGVPGQLNFTVLKDDVINFSEGNSVRLKVDGKDVFYGFVFTKKQNKENIISVTAYDQLRYLKNKDSYKYENKTVGELIRKIASDFAMKTGILEDTGFKIATRIEESTSLFDIIQTALDLTLQNTKEMYVMFDDFGKISLKNISSMQVGIQIDEETGENFDYTSSIDANTYNHIRLFHPKDVNLTPVEVYDINTINQWGVLQYVDTLKENENGRAKAEALLSLYNSKTRNLSISKAFGDTRVRAGCMIPVMLDLGDMKIESFMIVEKCKHTFNESEHFMDLTLRGGEFIA